MTNLTCPLTAGIDHIRFLHFLSARSLSDFKYIEDRKRHYSSRFYKNPHYFFQI